MHHLHHACTILANGLDLRWTRVAHDVPFVALVLQATARVGSDPDVEPAICILRNNKSALDLNSKRIETRTNGSSEGRAGWFFFLWALRVIAGELTLQGRSPTAVARLLGCVSRKFVWYWSRKITDPTFKPGRRLPFAA